MTEVFERLRDEAQRLDTPDVDAAAVIGRGRRLRRRRRGAQGLVAAAVVGVLGLTYAGVGSIGDRDAAAPGFTSSGAIAGAQEWAIASGSTVHLASGGTVTVPGKVKSLYYTSAGVLVRTGLTSSTDEAISNYWLVGRDGTVQDFRLSLGDRVPSTDPTLPYIAYAEAGADDEHWRVVLRDVRTGEVAHAVPVDGRFSWGGWVAPPVSLTGDHVLVGLDEATLDVDWRTSEVSQAEALPRSTMPTARAGRELVTRQDVVDDQMRGSARVVDVETGETLLRLEYGDMYPALSPDGRHVLVLPTRMCEQGGGCSFEEKTATVYDVDAGTQRQVDITGDAAGWTADGDLVQYGDGEVTVCDEKDCTSTPVDVDDKDLRVAGSLYES